MFSALKRVLGIRTIKKSTETPLFSGSAYFSNRVPTAVSEKWVAHGGEISSGMTLDVRARYFFAIDPSEPWVTKLFAKSVMVIHAGWIVHCVEEAFQVPIAKYILDDGFVPEPPYKLINNFAPPIHAPLCEPAEPTDGTDPGESGLQSSDTPSTPTSMPRKRKREQAYFDSPSGSLVFSGFDKDGMPRRPRKQRKLRFDPSFSPQGGKSGRDVVLGPGLDLFRDHHDGSGDDAELGGERGKGVGVGTLRGYGTMVRSPDTPDRPLAHEGPSATTYQHLVADEHSSKPAHVSPPAISIDTPKKISPVRTIDFTNLPLPTRRRRFLETDDTKSGETGTILSVVKSTHHKIKTPKKISFADHARVCVYTVSPRRPDTKHDADAGSERPSLNEGFEGGLEVDDKTRMSSDEAKGSDNLAVEATKDMASQTDSDPKKMSDDATRPPDEDPSTNDTLTLTMEAVQTMRRRLLVSAKNGVENGQLATLFELGKTFREMEFRHVW